MHERIGRARQRYPSVQYYYNIEVKENSQTNKVVAKQQSKTE